MASFLGEAFKGAKADIESAGHELLPRLARALRVARILLTEIVAIVALAPYGAYAMSVYRRLSTIPGMAAAVPPPPLAPQPRGDSAGAAPTAAAAATAAATPAPDLTESIRRLPPGRDGVAVQRGVSYGPAARNTLDVYVPLPAAAAAASAAGASAGGGGGGGGLPVVFFVHGGVWASGETWQYAPLAARLAQAGVVVVVPTYTLYPEALVGTMVEEVSAALSWTFDNAARYGGDPSRITAAGHSAGGHLVAAALLRRAAAAEAAAVTAGATASTYQPTAAPAQRPSLHGKDHAGNGKRDGSHTDSRQRQRPDSPQGSAARGGDVRETGAYLLGGGGASVAGAVHALRAVADAQLHPAPGVDSSYDDDGGAASAAAAAAAAPHHAEADSRMPRVFVGMSAVYDIAKHYEFEKARGVNELSMMKRAVGGHAGFAAASPTVVLAAAADAADAAAAAAGDRNGGNAGAAASGSDPSFFSSFELAGDAIPARAGLAGGIAGGAALAAAPGGGPAFSLAAARWLPPCVVAGSCSDHMVPWHEGAELVAQLRRCGVPVRPLLYNHVGHGDFVMEWRPLDVRQRRRQQQPQQRRDPEAAAAGAAAPGGWLGEDTEGLLPCAIDFLRIATGRVRPVPEAGAPPAPGPNGGVAAAAAAALSPGSTAVAAEDLVVVQSRM
ncbi:hypothetical protein GPECTOR_510g480 [Gonium pectorale]|uniref:Alpha/beta hydrolase fold-3 domain-containing protein n=1 Tax=Gonium pectorale TaxID=33097 RepID=A0A150FUW0_GONPE|nr:hypothetical protein GPECTOR_510g480 [Gonium pectorale]|eukprot:KXZ41379.1 hypothetical protein GPECTOR_510g480 [Gonium pectorale]